MLESGTIWPSQSVWCNTVVLVRKKDRGLHFCLDFCHLKHHTKKDSYPLPRIQKALESLVGVGHFLCLDLKLGFWQIKMEEVSKQYTTFTLGNLGFFKCECMPFGPCNVPTTFQWLMQNCLSKLNLIYCLIYLVDIIVFSQTAEEHLHQLCVVFNQSHMFLVLPLLICMNCNPFPSNQLSLWVLFLHHLYHSLFLRKYLWTPFQYSWLYIHSI